MKKEVLALAIGIGLLPPIWAVASGHFGITCGAVALICAGIYVAGGNAVENGLKMSIGFLMADLWAVIAMWSMEHLPFTPDVNTFLTLAVMGFAAVLIASALDKWIYLPAVLCGWAVGLTVMGRGSHRDGPARHRRHGNAAHPDRRGYARRRVVRGLGRRRLLQAPPQALEVASARHIRYVSSLPHILRDVRQCSVRASLCAEPEEPCRVAAHDVVAVR